MRSKRKTRHRRATEGMGYMFHGSFTSKTKAEAKARARGGFFVSRKLPGRQGIRYVVMTERAPF
jgi:hypothetical protein